MKLPYILSVEFFKGAISLIQILCITLSSMLLSPQTYSWILSAQIFHRVLSLQFYSQIFVVTDLITDSYAEIISISVLLWDVSLQTKSCFLSSQTYLQILSSQTSQNK